jgi:hypothetical protein
MRFKSFSGHYRMMFLCFESIASIRNLRRSDGGGNTYQDSGVLVGVM